MLRAVLHLLFPPRCLLCRRLLKKEESDLCHSCRTHTPALSGRKKRLPFVAWWTGLWYYKEDVRKSILRYKFYNRRSYAPVYGRLLAMKLLEEAVSFDVLTWVPISRLRRWKRGYDQVELIARAVAGELQVPLVRALDKIRNTPPQSGLRDVAARRANVLGVYRPVDAGQFLGKRVLLLDDVLTTGATVCECARTLVTAGAAEVCVAVIAVASQDKKQNPLTD